jgi:hypothetical protein
LNEAVEIAYGGPELGSDGTRDHCQSIVALGKEAWLTAVTDPGAFYVQFRNKMPKYPLIVDESCFGAPLYDEAVARFGEDFLEKWIVMMGQRDVFSNNYPAQLVEFYYPRIYQRSNQKDKKSIEHITVAKSGRQQQSSDLFFWRIIESTVNVPAEKKAASIRELLNGLSKDEYLAFAAFFHFYFKKLGGGMHVEALDLFYGGHESQQIELQSHYLWIMSLGFEKFALAISDPDSFYVQNGIMQNGNAPVFPEFLTTLNECETKKFGRALNEQDFPIKSYRRYEDDLSHIPDSQFKLMYPALYEKHSKSK